MENLFIGVELGPRVKFTGSHRETAGVDKRLSDMGNTVLGLADVNHHDVEISTFITLHAGCLLCCLHWTTYSGDT